MRQDKIILEKYTNNRNIGIDILKIILAFLIIIHINAGGTGKVALYASGFFVKSIVWGLQYFSFGAVNCYVIITGMFSYTKHADIHQIIKKLSKLWLSLLFFSLGGYFTVSIAFERTILLSDIIKRIFPVIRGEWWFMTCYFAILLFSPFLNQLVDNLDKQNFRMLIFVLTITFSFIPFLAQWTDALGINYGYSFAWFIQLYITGCYMSKHSEDFKGKALCYLTKYTIISILLLLSMGLVKIPLIKNFNFFAYNSVLAYMAAIYLVLGFSKICLNLDSKISSVINIVAGLSMSSYLLHCQTDVESVLWETLNLTQYANSLKIIIVYAIVIGGIYFSALIIEYLRNKLVKICDFDNKFSIFVKTCFMSIFRFTQKLIGKII